ncbi:glycosyltransferase family 9 protein [bacterium]|nr:glycosyltransferase family 9 protein [bacterium]
MQEQFRQLTDAEKKEIRKILIIQQKPFGDVLLNTGYFAELRRHFPHAEIHYLVQRPYATILEENPYLDKLIVMEKKRGVSKLVPLLRTIVRVRAEKYDLIIDQLRGTSSARIVLFSGARYRLGHLKKVKKKFGFPMRKWNWMYNLSIPRGQIRYYSRFKFDLLKPLGIGEVPHQLYYHVRDESAEYIGKWLKQTGLKDRPMIVFSPGTPILSKRWNLQCYARLGDMIQTRLEYKIVILWAPDEKEDAETVMRHMKTEAVLALPTDLNQAAALLHHAKVLICNDGGLNHVAVSQQVPSIAIFGPQSFPDKWCAWHIPIHMYLKDWTFRDKSDDTFNIMPEVVFQKLLDHLNNKENRNLNELAIKEDKNKEQRSKIKE